MKTTSFAPLWKISWPHLLVLLSFLLISVAYFAPRLEGKQIQQHDVDQYRGMSQELRTYYLETGESSAWTGSMFSGMPAYQIGIFGSPDNPLNWLEAPFRALGTMDIGVLYLAMITFYVLALIAGANIPIAAAGALAFAFSSYNIIILDAGHITKMWAMAYIPLILAGLLLLYKKNYLWGALVFAIALTLQIKNNHFQITYYTAIFCAILYIGFLIRSCVQKQWGHWLKTSLLLLIGVVISLLCNAGNLYSTYEYSKETIRGQSELSHGTDGKTDKSSGLDKSYAFDWSYGKAETLTLLIPDFYGGASGGYVTEDSHLSQAMTQNGYKAEPKMQTYTYWGEQPFTSGPVYFGAIICFLFVLSLFILKNNPFKWWMVGGAFLFILLSWGKNLEIFNDWFFYHFPMYNKFRAVSMALVIPQIVFPIMAMLCLKEIFQKGVEARYLKKMIVNSAVFTGGICMVLAFVPSLFLDFTATADASYGLPGWYMQALQLDREALLKADALRSLVFIVLSAALLWWFAQKPQSGMAKWSPVLIALMILIDLWNVDKRYLNADKFVQATEAQSAFPPTQADQIILQDKDLSYRVLNLNNPFNETRTSYFHKSIGGYHAAKLRRYQELIEMELTDEISSVVETFQTATKAEDIQSAFASTPGLNMLNMRYLIFSPEQPPIVNAYAYGNGWFVEHVQWVENADQEMQSLSKTDLRRTALIDQRFASVVSPDKKIVSDSTASVALTAYQPDQLTYTTRSLSDGMAVFSEVYFDQGWKAFIDGKEVPHFRANWILRGLVIPAGEHQVVFRFEPDGYYFASGLSLGGSYLLFVSLLILCGCIVVGRRKETVSTDGK